MIYTVFEEIKEEVLNYLKKQCKKIVDLHAKKKKKKSTWKTHAVYVKRYSPREKALWKWVNAATVVSPNTT